MITIVGLGPGDPADLTIRAREALVSGSPLFLRTELHPTVAALSRWGLKWESFDRFYREYESFDRVYESIVRLLLETGTTRDLVYAVPGHPLVGEATVQALLAQTEVPVTVVPGLSGLEAVYARIGLDPSLGLQIVDALRIGEQDLASDRHTLVLQVFNRAIASTVKLELMRFFADEHPVTLLRAAGVPNLERTETVPLFELDRREWIDHLTTVYLPPGNLRGVPRLVALMHRLRAPGGCAWDGEQTHQSLRRYCLEEAYEVVDAIDQGDDDALEEELGDLLLQVVFHSELASEEGRWTLPDVADRVCDKLVARHPHVFGSEPQSHTATEHLRRWEAAKAAEKPAGASALAGVPLALPALTASEKLQSKAALQGFVWPNWQGAQAKLREEWLELQDALHQAERSDPADAGPAKDRLKAELAHEIGDVFTALVNLARFWHIDPEQALRDANSRFVRRFQAMEKLAGGSLAGRALDELLHLWTQGKALVAQEERSARN